jgi:hypothetical protein
MFFESKFRLRRAAPFGARDEKAGDRQGDLDEDGWQDARVDTFGGQFECTEASERHADEYEAADQSRLEDAYNF